MSETMFKTKCNIENNVENAFNYLLKLICTGSLWMYFPVSAWAGM